MDRANYAKMEPLENDVILEALGELQEEWDDYEAAREEASDKAGAKKKARDTVSEKMHKVVRAHRDSRPVFLLRDGNLTDEKPDDPDLFSKAEEPSIHGEANTKPPRKKKVVKKKATRKKAPKASDI